MSANQNPKCKDCGGPTILLLTSFVCAKECDLLPAPKPKVIRRQEPEMDIEITEEIPKDWVTFMDGVDWGMGFRLRPLRTR